MPMTDAAACRLVADYYGPRTCAGWVPGSGPGLTPSSGRPRGGHSVRRSCRGLQQGPGDGRAQLCGATRSLRSWRSAPLVVMAILRRLSRRTASCSPLWTATACWPRLTPCPLSTHPAPRDMACGHRTGPARRRVGHQPGDGSGSRLAGRADRLPGWHTSVRPGLRPAAGAGRGLPDERHVAHGDLVNHNVLVRGPRITAVID